VLRARSVTLRVRRAFDADRLRSVLVVCPNWLGDAVLALPTLVNLRRSLPDARISLLTRPGVSDLFRAAPFIDQLLEIPGRRQLAWAVNGLRRQRFELVVLLTNSFRAGLISALAGIPNRVGYATDGRWPLLTVGVSPPRRGSLHQADYYLGLLRALRWDAWEDPKGLTLPADSDEEARRLLAASGVGPEVPLIGLNPGAAYGSAKRWPLERFARAADLLAERRGTAALLFGAPAEVSLTDSIRKIMRGMAIDLGGRTSLGTFASLLGRCRLLLTNDTGAMHLGAALGVSCVAVFGPTDPRLTGPFGRGHQVLRIPPACSPCRYRDCPIDHRCLRAIDVEAVVAAAESVLDRAVTPKPRREGKTPAVFLDRDGTINEEVGPVQGPELMKPIPGVAGALKRLGEAGFLRIIISNQSRVARGDASEELIEATHQRLLRLLQLDGGWAEAFYYCPHHPSEGRFPYKRTCGCRKPSAGLIHRAVSEHRVDLSRSYVIGDQASDIILAQRVGLRSVLVLSGFGRDELRRLLERGNPGPDHVALDLMAATDWILTRGGSA
jgi:heptosyltransferase-2